MNELIIIGLKNEIKNILETSLSYQSVLYYRIAHYLYHNNNQLMARKISEYAKKMTNIEIHPAAKIGKNFVIDHGIGTVIGETAEIGNNCYLLQNVILGSSKITGHKIYHRHPKIGNNVEIGGNSKLLGPIHIGDNVKISPNAIINQDVKENRKVIVSSTFQMERNKGDFLFTGYQYSDANLILHFWGLDTTKIQKVTCHSNHHGNLDVSLSTNKITIFNHEQNNNYFDIDFFNKNTRINNLRLYLTGEKQ